MKEIDLSAKRKIVGHFGNNGGDVVVNEELTKKEIHGCVKMGVHKDEKDHKRLPKQGD